MKILKRLLPFARPLHHFLPEYVIYTILGILFGVLNISLLIPVLQLLFSQSPEVPARLPEASFSFSYIRDYFNYEFSSIMEEQGKFMALVFVCIFIMFGILLANVFRYLAVRVLLRFRLKVMEGLRNKLYDKYLAQSLRFHHNHAKGELIQTLTGEVQEIDTNVITPAQVLIRDPLMVIAYFIVLFIWSPELTLFTLIFLPITGIVITMLTQRLKKMTYYSQELQSRILSFTEESLGGIKQIQSFVAEKLMGSKFREVNHDLVRQGKQLQNKKELASPISEVIGVIAAVSLVMFGGYLILHGKSGDLTGPKFIAYIAMYTQVIPPLKALSQTVSSLQRGVVACEKYFSFIDEPVTVVNHENAQEKKEFREFIDIRNINFRYEQKPILKQINLRIPKGKTVALVGQSGSGKSTLVDLIARFYDVQEGSITLDGTDIRDIRLADLRNLIGVVSQESFLFNDTVYNNILLGNQQANAAEVEDAARVANAHDFIEQMEAGYLSMTGERGVKLSGGQRQRVSIARAVLKNAPILILDEATSALDTESEKLVQEALNKLLTNRTSIIIAHRLSTVRHADEIIVLHEGEIRERGTHDELLQQNGLYRKLVDMQEIK